MSTSASDIGSPTVVLIRQKEEDPPVRRVLLTSKYFVDSDGSRPEQIGADTRLERAHADEEPYGVRNLRMY